MSLAPPSSTMACKGTPSDSSPSCGIRRGNLRIVNGKAEKIPRPMNAFMLFSNVFRKQVKDEFRDEPNNVISKRLGAMWKAMTAEDRMKYHNLAKEAEKEHKRKYPNYQYCPGEARKFKKARLEEKARQEALYRSILQTSGFGARKTPSRPLPYALQNTPTFKSNNVRNAQPPSTPTVSQPLAMMPQNIQILKPAILAVPATVPSSIRKQISESETGHGDIQSTPAREDTDNKAANSRGEWSQRSHGKHLSQIASLPAAPTFFRIDTNLLPRPAHQPSNRLYPPGDESGNTREEFIPQLVYVPCEVKYAEQFGWTKEMFYSPSLTQSKKHQKENALTKTPSNTSAISDTSVNYGNYFSAMDGSCWGVDEMTQPQPVSVVRRRSFSGSPPKENGLNPTYAVLSESIGSSSSASIESKSTSSLSEVTPDKLKQMVDGATLDK